jgi:glutathione S-transferase kappa 1
MPLSAGPHPCQLAPMQIELWFDVVSPYSYLAYKVLDRYRRKWGFTLVMKPAFLGGVMKAVGNQAPITLPARAPWLVEDVRGQSRFFDITIDVPDGFPHLTIQSMRLLCALCDRKDARAEHVAEALWHGYFAEGKLPDDPEVMRAACTSAELSDKEVDELMARIGTDEIKDKLRAATETIVERGAFGFPVIYVERDGERRRYFGSDRFERIAFEHGLPWHGPRG